MIDNLIILCFYSALFFLVLGIAGAIAEFVEHLNEQRMVKRKMRERFLRLSGYKGN